MKRTILFVLITIALVTFAQAQGIGQQGNGQQDGTAPARQSDRPSARADARQSDRPARAAPEAVTVTGNLTIAQGMIALKAGDITYLTPSLNRYVGFIDTLKDGAQVKLEGFAAPSRTPNRAKADSEKAANKVTFFMPNKLTIAGKDYDLGRPQMNMGFQPRQNFNGQQWQKGRHGNQGNKNYGNRDGRDGRHQQGKWKNAPQGRNGPRR